MSNKINDELMDRVGELIEYYLSNMEGRILQSDMERNDLESLKYHADLFYKQMMHEQENELLGREVSVY